MPVRSATLSAVKRLLIVAFLLAFSAAPAIPIVPAQGLPGGRRPDAIDRATGLANQPYSTPPPAPQRPVDRYVPPQRVYSPSLGREVVVPPHYEGRPGSPPVVTNPDGRQPTLLPPGSLPPVDRGAP